MTKTAAELNQMPAQKQAIIDALLAGSLLVEACAELGLRFSRVKGWRDKDKEFDEAVHDALEAQTDALEKEAVRRAQHGIQKPLVANGRLVMDPSDPNKPFYVREYSDTLMMFLLKGRRREIYGEQKQVDATVKFDPAGAKDELRRKLDSATASTAAAALSGESD